MSSPRAGVSGVSSGRGAERHGRSVSGCSAPVTRNPGEDSVSSILISDDGSDEEDVRNPSCESGFLFSVLHNTGPYFEKAMYSLIQRFSARFWCREAGRDAGLGPDHGSFPFSLFELTLT